MEISTKRKLTLATCCGAHIVQDGLSAALYVLMPILAQSFGLNYAQIGMLRSLHSATMSLFEVPSGVLAERFGERRLLVFGLICAGLGYLWLSTATSIWVIAMSFLLIGTGGAFQHALTSSLISNNYHDAGRRSALGIYNSAGDAGKLIFTGLLGLATGIGIAWQSAVIFFGVVALLFALVLLYTLRHIKVGGGRASTSPENTSVGPGGWGILDRTGFSTLCLSVFIDTAVQSAFLVFIVFVIAEKGVSNQLATFALILTLIGGMFGKAGCGYLAQRFGVRSSFALVQCATAAGIIALLMSPALVAFILLPILGMFLQGSTSITYGSISDLIRSDRQSRGFALLYSLAGLSAIVGPVTFGFISDYSGLNTAMMAMAFISLLAIPPLMFLRPNLAG